MAASLSRPDPSSPASVAEAGFSTTRRGYSQDEVRAFLTSVAAELGRLQERERQLEAQVLAAEVEVAPAPELDEETVAAILGEETLRVLQTARESASQIKIRAEDNAARIIGDANDEVNRLRQEAEVEAGRKRHDASSDAEAEVALAKQQGREMVNEARAYRERVLADLERRTKLARQQIEELVHGRDRLLQVFERARLVAVDVTTELQSVDGPEELVNFSPTTGPLPLMVPAGELDRSSSRPSPPEDATPTGTDDDSAESADPVDETDRDAVEPAPEWRTDEGHSNESQATETSGDDTLTEGAAAESVDDDVSEPQQNDAAASESADLDGPDEPDELQDAGDDEAASDEPATPKRDANVVSLFPDRPAEARADADADADAESTPHDEADSAADADTDERPDVNGIFERLRSETPDDSEGDADTEADAGGEAGEIDEASVEPVSTAFTRRDQALVPLIVSGARRVKRVLADEQNGVLDLLRRNEPITQLEELVAEPEGHVQIYVDALADELLDAAVAGADEVGKNDTKTLRTTLRRGALERANGIVGDDLVLPLRQRLERAITDGAGDNEDITKRVRAVYREWKTQHIDDQLDDAFRFAHGGGLSVAVKPGTKLTWSIDPSEPTCPDCEDNSLADAVAAGDEFPTGHVNAPAHPGCRCLTVPVDQ